MSYEHYKDKIASIISPCCKSFMHYVDGICICSNCGQIVKQIETDEELITSIHYNGNSAYDLLESDHHKDKRFAHDPTCELSAIKCDKCNSLMRLTRDVLNQHVCICTKCRNVVAF